MFGISLVSLVLRFFIGGIAVAAASILAGKLGGKIGGIIATLPAVYIAAIVTLLLDHRGEDLVQMSIHLSAGAILGIVACIITVAFASVYIRRNGFQKGTLFVIVFWLLLSCVFFGMKQMI